jgi:thioredoxin 1
MVTYPLTMKTITEISEAEFEATVLNAAFPVAVSFYAPWSRHCQVMEPVLAEAAKATGSPFFCVNVSRYPGLSGWYGVESIPTVLFFRKGEIADKIVGVASKEEILGKLKVAELETANNLD